MSLESITYHDICDDCAHKGYCDMAQFGGHNPRITACSHFSKRKQTNADRIRSMSDEELADFINDAEYGFLDRPGMCDVCDHHRVKDCLACWLAWLKSPVEEGDNG